MVNISSETLENDACRIDLNLTDEQKETGALSFREILFNESRSMPWR